jgi:hypothetical protein
MAFKIFIKPIVFIDLDEAINWYESEQNGLVADFMNPLKPQSRESKTIPMHLLMLFRG